LQRAVKVGKGFGAAAETHVLAEVVAAVKTVSTFPAVDAGLDGNTLADLERGDAVSDGCDDTGSLVTKDERVLEDKVAVAAVDIVVHW
jgi:hypothetical protein